MAPASGSCCGSSHRSCIWCSVSALRCTSPSPAERPELVISDVIMPAMSGFRMIDEMTSIDPDIRVIYMSGYVQSRISLPGTPGSVVAFLEKPFTREALLATFRQVMASPSA